MARGATAPTPAAQTTEHADATVSLGARLREARMKSGLSLRAVARELDVSPSFVSQIENDRSRPSVATLYSISQLLDVSLDDLFVSEPSTAVVVSAPATVAAVSPFKGAAVRRSDFGSPADAWEPDATARRTSVTAPGERSRLVMDSGVVWEQLASSAGHGIDFIEIVYPPGSSSTSDSAMLRHAGFECGYLIEGELEITVGFESFTIRSGGAIGFDCSQPHLLRNPGAVPARGIWCVFR
jgi:transcriptional regulator with XRE-family HTH domain/mannose-6-phosphate isomerase-like protein (cupin superfamily)